MPGYVCTAAPLVSEQKHSTQIAETQARPAPQGYLRYGSGTSLAQFGARHSNRPRLLFETDGLPVFPALKENLLQNQATHSR